MRRTEPEQRKIRKRRQMTNRKSSTIHFVILSFMFSVSCNAQQKKFTDACTISKNIDNYATLIKSDSFKIVLSKSDDNCNLRLVDSTYSKFLRIPDRQAFDIFAGLANKSDGYVSEYIVERVGKVYYTGFGPFFNFLYEDFTNKRKSKLEAFLVECWSSIAATSDNTITAIARIRKNTHTIIGKQQTDLQNRTKYLNTLLARINAKYLD
jgi:hypothetical protein